jgi:hypothetical protein
MGVRGMTEAASFFQEINRLFDPESRSRLLSQLAEANGR